MKDLIRKYKYLVIAAAAVLVLAVVLIVVLTGKKEEAFVNFKQEAPEFAGYGQAVRIESSDKVDSLNLAIAAGIGIYWFTRTPEG